MQQPQNAVGSTSCPVQSRRFCPNRCAASYKRNCARLTSSLQIIWSQETSSLSPISLGSMATISNLSRISPCERTQTSPISHKLDRCRSPRACRVEEQRADCLRLGSCWAICRSNLTFSLLHGCEPIDWKHEVRAEKPGSTVCGCTVCLVYVRCHATLANNSRKRRN